MYFAAIISGFFSILSPSWGLFFILLLGGKYYHQQKYVFTGVTSIAALLFWFLSQSQFYVLLEIAGGVIVPYLLINRSFFSSHKLALSMFAVFVFGVIFSAVRVLFYQSIILENFRAALDETFQILEKNAESMPEFYRVEEVMTLFKEIFTKFEAAIWLAGILLAAYFGFILFARKQKIRIYHQSIQFPFFTVYFVIFALLLSLLPATKYVGLNILFMLAPIFFIQGLSIIDYYWRSFFQKSKLMMIILIVMVLFNIYFVSLIVLMGLMDTWFNFRKMKIQEETDESNTN